MNERDAAAHGNETPAPGSWQAQQLGCTCPVLDNAHGKGYMGRPGYYVYTVGCRVHDAPRGLSSDTRALAQEPEHGGGT